MKKHTSGRKKVVKKGWLINAGLSNSERNKIKVYLTKKRALASKYIQSGGDKKRVIPVSIHYTL